MIHLVRHGQTQANARGLLQGRADLPLTDLGRRQAEALRRVLPREATIIASPLRRAQETAQIIAGGAAVEVDPDWIELDYGQLDGQPLSALPPEEWERWRADQHFRLPGGETLVECGARVRRSCTRLGEAAGDGEVVVVSHVSPIKAAVAWALGTDDAVTWRMYLAVASVTRLAVNPRGPSLHSYNEIHHLSGLTPP